MIVYCPLDKGVEVHFLLFWARILPQSLFFSMKFRILGFNHVQLCHSNWLAPRYFSQLVGSCENWGNNIVIQNASRVQFRDRSGRKAHLFFSSQPERHGERVGQGQGPGQGSQVWYERSTACCSGRREREVEAPIADERFTFSCNKPHRFSNPQPRLFFHSLRCRGQITNYRSHVSIACLGRACLSVLRITLNSTFWGKFSATVGLFISLCGPNAEGDSNSARKRDRYSVPTK